MTADANQGQPATRLEGLLSIHEVADLLRVSPRTIHRWVAAGRLRTIKLGPFILRFQPSEVLRFTEQRIAVPMAFINRRR